jgi:hypothetical protein
MAEEESENSSLIEATPISNKLDTVPPVIGRNISYTYLLAIIVVILVLFLVYHAYSCFCVNQNLDFSEPYINKQPRSDPQDDNPFDVGDEVKKLIQLQEQYLEKLQRSRMGN